MTPARRGSCRSIALKLRGDDDPADGQRALIVVDDLEAAKAFFTELGMELEGEATNEGRSVDRVVGLDGVRADLAICAPRTATAGSS